MKRRVEEPENHERWLVSYADFITLLFAFFVVLYSISQVDLKKLSQAAKSFGNSFGGSVDVEGQSDPGRRVEPDAWRYAPIFPNVVPGGDPPESKALREVKDRLQSLLAQEKLDSSVKVTVEGRGLVVQLEPRAAFRENDVALSSGGAHLFSRLGAIVRALGSPVLIAGHAAPGAGHDVASSFERTSARAAAIVRFLEREQRFPPEKIFACTDGQTARPRGGSRPDGELELVVLRSTNEH